MPVDAGAWHTYRIDINGTTLNVWIDGQVGAANANVTGMTTSGHFLIGAGEYGQYTQFDNIALYSTFRDCGVATPAVGSPVVASNCIAEVGPLPHTQWAFDAPPNNGAGIWNGTFALRAFPTLCLASAPPDAAGTSWLVLATCDSSDLSQMWTWKFEGVAPDNERKSAIYNVKGCLDQFGENVSLSLCDAVLDSSSSCDPHPTFHSTQQYDIGQQMDAYACNGGENQAFFYDWDEGMIGNEATGACLGVGPCTPTA